MDLIKKLGGYEKARAMRDSNIDSFDGDASGVRIHYMGDCFYQEDLDLSLLKYRRANNIFEKDDYIVFDVTKPFFAKTQPDLMKVINPEYQEHDMIVLIDNQIYVVGGKAVRHATNEEIAAGHRL